jgi:ketopantoate reductase
MAQKSRNMKALIIGCGAIGGHLAYCLYENGFDVLIIAKKDSYQKIKKEGLRIQINKNKKIIKKAHLKIDNKFKIYKSLKDIKGLNLDFVFITVKLKDYDSKLIKSILTLTNKNTAIIPPCTNVPYWWTNFFYKNNEKKIKKNYFRMENIIGMTMWVSSVKKNPNQVIVKHIQRGYPLKPLNKKMSKKANKLRNALKYSCKSPKINNIYSEVFIKSLNALAFNMVALYYQQNNESLKKNAKAIKMVEKIMLEGEEIMKPLKITHPQNYKERISQTLSSSVHTMSMLNDYKKGKKIELKYLWKSFQEISSLSKISMPYTKKIYNELYKSLEYNENL